MRTTKWMAALVSAGAFALALPVCAAETLAVRDGRVPATVPGQRVAAAYMTIESPVAARVVAAESNVAASVQFHAMSMDGEIMRMRHLDELELPAGRPVSLAPGGVHLMLAGLSRPLRPGAAVDIRLTVRGADGASRIVRVSLPVVARRPEPGGDHD